MAVYGKWRRRWREGQINTAIFPPPSFAPEYDLTSSDAPVASFPPSVGFSHAAPDRRSPRSPPGLRNPFVHPSVHPSVRPSRRVSAALISGRVCPRYDGKRWKEEEGGSTGLHHSAVKPSQPANPKIVVFECVGAKSGGSSGGRVAPREQI